MDLLPRKDFKRAWAPLTMGFFSVVAGLFFVFHAGSIPLAEKAPPGLRGDEQQVLIAALDRLDAKYPQFHPQIREVEDTLIRSPEVATLSALNSNSLAEISDHRLFFSDSFFKSDSLAQEESLIYLIATLHPDMGARASLAKKGTGEFIGKGESFE